MPLCKVESIKVVNEEIHEKWVKDNMWFTFARHYTLFSDPQWFMSDEAYLENQKRCEKYMAQPAETIYVEYIQELFERKELIYWSKSVNFKFIRFYTKKNELYAVFVHPQCISGYGIHLIGHAADHLIELIDDKITVELINKLYV